MDAEVIRNILSAASMILTAALWVITARDRRDRATKSSIDRVERTMADRLQSQSKELQTQEGRLNRVEENMAHAITHDDLAKIYDKLNETNSSLDRMLGEFTQVSHSLNRLYQNVLDKTK